MLKNKTTISLIIANLVNIFLAIILGWGLGTIMAIYWVQSIIIGIFTFAKLSSIPLEAYQKAIENGEIKLTVNGREITDPAEFKRKDPLFFLVHYGFFHICYLVFIISNVGNWGTLLPAIIPGTMFAFNHYYSFLQNRKGDMPQMIRPGNVFLRPYLRIIPMHLTILVGGNLIGFSPTGRNTFALVIFMLLKTVADVFMHELEHRPLKGIKSSMIDPAAS